MESFLEGKDLKKKIWPHHTTTFGMWDLSSPTRDATHTLYIGSAGS